MKAFTEVYDSAVHFAYVATYQIAKQKIAHTVWESLLLPVMKEVVKIMIGEKE